MNKRRQASMAIPTEPASDPEEFMERHKDAYDWLRGQKRASTM